MKISEAFPSKYLRAADIAGPVTYTIAHVVEQGFRDGERKLVVNFHDCRQALVLNQTNGRRLAEGLGDDTAAWCGRKVMLDVDDVWFGGAQIRSIRARAAAGATPAAAAGVAPWKTTKAAAATQNPLDDLDDEIPV